MNVLEEIEKRFPDFRSSNIDQEWNRLVESKSLGDFLTGKIVFHLPFGYLINIGERFPAIMLVTKIKSECNNLSIGDMISGNIYLFDSKLKEIALTQLGYEEWMEGQW